MDYYQKWGFAALVFLLSSAFLLVFGQTLLGIGCFSAFVVCIIAATSDY